MSETLSLRIDATVKKRLEALALQSKRSKSFLAAEAIAEYVKAEDWQLKEINQGLKDFDQGRAVSHEKVSKWLRSWGRAEMAKALLSLP